MQHRDLTDRATGKQWLPPKKAFRPTAGLKSYEKRTQERALAAQLKAKEKEMKAEKAEERQVCQPQTINLSEMGRENSLRRCLLTFLLLLYRDE